MSRCSSVGPTERHLHLVRAVLGISCCILVVFAGRMVGAADWPTYRADVARSGVTDHGIVHDLALQWDYRPLHPPKPAWPAPSEELPRMHVDNAYHVAIADGVVYFGSSVTNKVHANDAATGEARWTFSTQGPVRFAPTVCEGRIYVGSDDGYVYCLGAADGSLVWKYRAGPSGEKVIGNGRMISLWPVRTSVLVDNGFAYFAAGVFPYEGLYICALKADDGSVVWRNDTVGDRAHELEFGGISPHGYLVASPRILYVPSGRAMPAAFDRDTGKFLFSAPPGGKRGGTWALLDRNRLIAGVDQSGVPGKAAYDAATGQPQPDAYAWFKGIDMAVTAKDVYLVTRDGVYAVDRKAYAQAVRDSDTLAAQRQQWGKQLAALKKKQSDAGGQADAELAKSMDALAKKIRQAGTKQRHLKDSVYRWHLAGKTFTSVIRAGDTVLVGGQAIVVAIDAASGKEAWRHQVDGRAVGLAVADEQLVVSTDTGHVYAFGPSASAAEKTIGAGQPINPYPQDAWAEKYEAAARKIVADTGITKGYCLVADCGEGQLAYQLAKQTDLKIVGIERDPAKLATARARLQAAGLLGWRVVVEPWELETLPDYFANLIVSDGMLRTGQTAESPEQGYRVLRPWGGVAYVSMHDQGGITWKRLDRGPLEGAGQWTQQYADPHNTACSQDQLVTGSLGVLWFGEPGPQGMVERHGRAESPVAMNGRLFVEGEELIMALDAFNGTLLWKREIPGAVRVKIKADSGNLTLTETGLYVAARDKCYRLDLETGKTMHVFSLPAPRGARRRWGYLTVVDGVLYGSTAKAMDHPYGAILKTFLQDGQWRPLAEIPAEFQGEYERLKKQYPAARDLRMAAERYGLLYGPMTKFGRGGEFTQKNAVTENLMVSDSVFAFDTQSGKLLWSYPGKRIANITLVVGDNQIFLTDAAVTPEQRSQALVERKKLAETGAYQPRAGILDELTAKKQLLANYTKRKDRLVQSNQDHRQLDVLIYQTKYLIESLRAELFQVESPEGSLTYDDADVRMVVALDARRGNLLWKRPVDLTGCGGDKMGAAYRDQLLLFYGNHGNHDAWRFREGGMKWRRITTLSGKTGEMVWSRPLNYRTRPVIVGEKIILEPRACYLHTGETVMRQHPITGQEVPWEFLRPGHTCGITAASAEGLFYRSACTAFYDLARDSGVTTFGAYRPGCAISVIPACGLLLSPEASAGCTCSYPIRCSMALKRKPARPQPWTVYVTPGPMRPVKHLAVNLGAAADMKDDDGTVWLAYPNPNTAHFNHFPNYGVKLDLSEEILPGMGHFAHDFRGQTIAGTDKPWLFTSGCLGLIRCQLPLIDAEAGQPAGKYTVRLGLRAPAGDEPGQRVFDIKVEGNVACKGCDIAQLAKSPGEAVVKQFTGIPVRGDLLIELVPAASAPTETTAPVVQFIEVRREDGGA